MSDQLPKDAGHPCNDPSCEQCHPERFTEAFGCTPIAADPLSERDRVLPKLRAPASSLLLTRACTHPNVGPECPYCEIERLDADAACEKAEKESLKLEVERLTRERNEMARQVTVALSDNDRLRAELLKWGIHGWWDKGGAVEATGIAVELRELASDFDETRGARMSASNRCREGADEIERLTRERDEYARCLDGGTECAQEKLRLREALIELGDATLDTLRSHPETSCCTVTRELAEAAVRLAVNGEAPL